MNWFILTGPKCSLWLNNSAKYAYFSAPLFSRRRSPNNGQGGMYDSQSGFGGGGAQGRQMGGNNMGRSYQVSLIKY